MPSKPERRKEIYQEQHRYDFPVRILRATLRECSKAIAQSRHNLQPKVTHCLRGHLRTPENLRPNGTCITCGLELAATKRAQKAVLFSRAPKPPRTHCINGHLWNRNAQGVCRDCAREKKKRQDKKKREARALLPKFCKRGHPKDYKGRCRECRRTSNNTKHQTRRSRKTGAGGSYTVQQERALRLFYEDRCVCCGRTKEALAALGLCIVLDHVIAVAKGGTSWIHNMQPLCHHKAKGTYGCNETKGVEDTDYRLLWLLGLS